MTQINLIATLSYDMVIGKDGDLPWPRIPDDMSHFKHLTEDCPVIMGRKTWESIPEKYRPLSNRENIILTTQTPWIGTTTFMTLDKALRHVQHWDKVYIIGGGQVYKEALDRDLVDIMDLTWVDGEYEGDVFFPEFDREKWDIRNMGGAIAKNDVPAIMYKQYTRRRK